MPHTTSPVTGRDAPVRWLSPQEQQVWRDYLSVTQLLWERLSDALGGTELAMVEYEVLVRLSEAPQQSVRMSELAEGLAHSRSRLTHTVTRMEARGLVRRESCPQDRRGVLAVMTAAGTAALEAAAPTHVTSVREELFDPLAPEDVAGLGRVLAKISGHLQQG